LFALPEAAVIMDHDQPGEASTPVLCGDRQDVPIATHSLVPGHGDRRLVLRQMVVNIDPGQFL